MDRLNSPGLLSQVLDASDDQIYVIDLVRSRVIDCNDGACRALGYSRDALVGLDLACLDQNLWRGSPLNPALLQLQPGDPALLFRTSHLRSDGSAFPVEVSSRAVLVEGQVVHIAIGRDISSQRQFERELAESRRQFEALVHNLPGIVYRYELRPHPRFLWVDDRISELTLRSAAEYLNGEADFANDVAPTDYRRVTTAFGELAARGTGSLDLTYHLIAADGAHKLIRDTATIIAPTLPGEPVIVEGMMIDITEAAEQERVLREAWQAEHARYEFVVGASGQIVYEWDIAREMITWGGSLRAVLGYTEQQHLHSVADALLRVHPEDRAAYQQQTAPAMAHGASLSHEYRYQHADGSHRWVWDHVVYELDPAGELSRATGVLQDISARKRLEAQVSSAQRMETIGALAGGVAHDVNNYLATILGNVDVAMMRVLNPADWPELQDAHDAARGCAELVRSLLTFARQEGHSHGPLNLGGVVRDAVRMLRPLVGGEVLLQTSLQDDSLEFEADRVQVQQVIMNLVANSNDAMGGRGTITIGAAAVTLQHPETGQPGRFAHLWVVDSGPGIAANLRLKIFEPYFTTRPFGSGTGLGLSIVHGIAHAHGGWVEAAPICPGARISVFFPAG
ncbi:MAG: PAS domain-containing protein [Tepidiformaceae bacterium]